MLLRHFDVKMIFAAPDELKMPEIFGRLKSRKCL
jgi:hypothetical protein